MRKILLISSMLLVAFKMHAQDARIEAGLIYNFAINIEWPENRQKGDFVIAIIGEAKVESFLKSLAKSKKVGTRTIVIKKLKSISEVGECNILFFSKSMKAILPEAVNAAKSKNMLIITEGFSRTKKGAGISFTISSGTSDFKLKTGYDINPDALISCGLKPNKKILDLGNIQK